MSPATGHLLTALATLGRMAAANEIAMVISTPDGVRDANDAFLRLTGYTRADLRPGGCTGGCSPRRSGRAWTTAPSMS